MRRSKHNLDRATWQASGSRLYAKRGTDLPQARLTEADIAAIRRQHQRKQRLIARLNAAYSAASFAARYGVHVRTIEKALRADTWSHVRHD